MTERTRTILEAIATIASIAVLVVALFVMAANPAKAFVELDNDQCQQSDGALGVLNGTSLDDAGCITPAEYDQMWSIENLLDVGVIDSAVLNDDGTTTVHYSGGAVNTIVTEPLERPVAANPELEPDAPTVRVFLFGHVDFPV